MRTFARALGLAAVVALGATLAAAEETGIQWVKDLDTAKKQAAESKKLIHLKKDARSGSYVVTGFVRAK